MDWKTIKERLSSKVVWTAILAQVLLIVALYWPGIADQIKIVATAVIEILTLIGILNNPADKVNW